MVGGTRAFGNTTSGGTSGYDPGSLFGVNLYGIFNSVFVGNNGCIFGGVFGGGVFGGNIDNIIIGGNVSGFIGDFVNVRISAIYDFIFIDCPPSINMLTVNALTAADGVLIPMQCEYYALEGLSALLNTIEQVRDSVNPELEVFGILRTMYDPRINLSNEVSMQLIKHFDRKVFRTVIPRNVRLAEAPSFGRPVLLHDRSSRGAISYLALAGEILRREDARDQQLRAI